MDDFSLSVLCVLCSVSAAVELLAVLGFVVCIAADFPQVGLEGLATSGIVLLCDERCLVLRQGGEIPPASVDRCLNGSKTVTSVELFGRRFAGTGDGTQSAQVQTGTAGVGRRGYTVGSKNHLLVRCVRRFLVDFGEGTADSLDRVSIFYFCHCILTMFYLRPA